MSKTQTDTRIDATSRPQVAAADDGPKQSLVDLAYDELRKRILDNFYSPGYQALEGELALQLGISRTPVREALIRLEKEGLLEIIPRHGVRILPVSPTVMREIYEILTALESAAAELVANRRPSEEELQPLVQASKDMAKALRADDLDAWAEADERFHRRLIEMSGNKLLVQTVFNFWDRAHRARMVTLRLRRKPVNSTKEHMEMVEMIRKGDARGVVEINRAHRQRASRELLEIFERYRFSHL